MDTAVWKRMRHLLNNYQIVTFDISQGKQDSNPHRRFWRPLNYPCSIPLNVARKILRLAQNDLSATSIPVRLLNNLDHLASANGTAALADSELLALVHSDRGDKSDGDLDVIARHNHLHTLGKHDLTGDVKRTDEELRTIVVVERSVAAAFVLLQDVDLSLEHSVRSDGLGLGHDLTSLDFLLVNTTEEETYVVTSLTLVEELAEHLDTGDDSLTRLICETNELDRIADVDGTSLDTTGNDSTTASDGEDVLDRHKEGLVNKTLRKRNVAVNSLHELHDLVFPDFLAVKGTQSGTADDRAVLIKLVESEEVADLHLNEVKHFLIVNEIDLVHEDKDLRDVDLTGEQDVLTGLRHRTVSGGDNKDSTVHLSSTSNHVLNVVSVAWAVYVGIVTVGGLVLDMGRVDGDTTLLLLRGVVDLVEGLDLVGVTSDSLSENLGNGGGQGRLTVVNMANCTDVDMRLGSLECFFCHNIMN